MGKTVLVLLTTLLVVAGCGKDDPKTVTFYVSNDLLREDMIARCNADGGKLRGSPDCVNAGRASARVAAQRDHERKAAREAASERKLAAIRARQNQLLIEQAQLEKQAAQLQELEGVTPKAQPGTDAPQPEKRSFGAPTRAPIVNEPFQPDASQPPIIGYENVDGSQTPPPSEPQTDGNNAQTVSVRPVVEPDPNVAQQAPVSEPAQTQDEEWVVTPSQVQPSPVVVETPEVPAKDPSSISLDDLPGSEVSGASVPTDSVRAVKDAVQEVIEEQQDQ